MDFTGIFVYNDANLIVSHINWMFAVGLAVCFVGLILLMRFLFLMFAGMYWIYQERKVLENRKKTLSDLVLMKDIQTELEKEIEQATLKAAFQN